ncbi:MAG TPA: hypothetical protein PKV27_13065, partial [Ilumatobacteraceae bacterium]|nr:hypothetical protein [Ilumatobacteraceae bacterium]
MGAAQRVSIGDRQVSLTNLDKVLYPQTGTTKAEVIQYYSAIAPVMLPHLTGRCTTLKRYPDGVESDGFFEKRCPKHRPEWMPVALGPGDRRGGIEYCEFDEPAALVWSANMAALELHVPMALAADLDTPRAVVFDFDPGAPATITECCQVAMMVRDLLDHVGLRAWAKTSGSKGLQVYIPLNSPCSHETAADFALAVGQLLERDH